MPCGQTDLILSTKFVNDLKHWLCSRKQVIKISGVRTPVLTLLDCLLCRRQLGKPGQPHTSTFALCSLWRPPAILSMPLSFPSCIPSPTVCLGGWYLHSTGDAAPGASLNPSEVPTKLLSVTDDHCCEHTAMLRCGFIPPLAGEDSYLVSNTPAK